MKERAFLLTSRDTSCTDSVAKVLQFFGVDYCYLTVEEFLSSRRERDGQGCENPPRLRIICPSDIFAELITQLERSSEAVDWWHDHTHSVFVYAGANRDKLEKLVMTLSRDDAATIDEITPGPREFTVASETDGFSGVMAGVKGIVSAEGIAKSYVLRSSNSAGIDIISVDEGAIFLKFSYHGIPVFVSTSTGIIDIDRTLANGIFDIRDHVSAALPIALYIKWAFARACWNPAETSACLVIDDPLLRANHGFVNFRELLSLMGRHRFSTNIAFIPWNWRRSAPEVIRLFRQNPESYSISVHGCDHSRAEFGSTDRESLDRTARQAVQRMDQHEARNGLGYDQVMVFPQGIFSKAAISALKRTGFIAAVNNDTIAVDSGPDAISIADFWDVAVMNYENFPIFTRRYPWEGIENFAFDILLGKPAVIVIHHDYCGDQCRELVTFVERLNSLKCALRWRSLGGVIRSSFRHRELSPGLVEVEMYGTELRLENSSAERRRYVIRKRESQPSDIQEIRAEDAKLLWHSKDSHVCFETELAPAESRMLSIRFHAMNGNGERKNNIGYKAKTLLRRYLCEVRDNYVTTTKSRFADFVRTNSLKRDNVKSLNH